MTLFFIEKERVPGLDNQIDQRMFAKLVTISEVIVIVDKNDFWRTIKDRRGNWIVEEEFTPQCKAKLLTDYHVVVRPTAGRA